jgi:hypothetical protein
MSFDPELERRVRVLEAPAEKGSGFTGRDWLAFILLGVALPIAISVWGWLP